MLKITLTLTSGLTNANNEEFTTQVDMERDDYWASELALSHLQERLMSKIETYVDEHLEAVKALR